jgi:hypothetical protein
MHIRHTDSREAIACVAQLHIAEDWYCRILVQRLPIYFSLGMRRFSAEANPLVRRRYSRDHRRWRT